MKTINISIIIIMIMKMSTIIMKTTLIITMKTMKINMIIYINSMKKITFTIMNIKRKAFIIIMSIKMMTILKITIMTIIMDQVNVLLQKRNPRTTSKELFQTFMKRTTPMSN